MSHDALDHVRAWKPYSKQERFEYARELPFKDAKNEKDKLAKKFRETVENQLIMAGLK